MAFLDEIDGLRTKIHAGSVPKPVLAGVAALALVVVALVAWNAAGALHAAGNAGFEIERAEAAASAEEDGAQDAEGSDASDAAADEAGAEADGVDESGARQDADTVFVHVAGAVAAPGVYELPADARVQAAVDAAGGFSADAAQDAVNCARTVQDGEQILVPTMAQRQDGAMPAAGESTASAGAGASPGNAGSSGAAGGKVNINQAGVEELDTLPGVGPSTAEKIVADREANGPFASIEDLKRVSGIGDKKYEQLSGLITV